MIKPTENDIGRGVIYTGNRGWKPDGSADEAGVITSFNNTCVFVRYGSNKGSKGFYSTHRPLRRNVCFP